MSAFNATPWGCNAGGDHHQKFIDVIWQRVENMREQAQGGINSLAGWLPQCMKKHSRAVSVTIWGLEVWGGGMRAEGTLGPSSRQQSHSPKTLVNVDQDSGSRWK